MYLDERHTSGSTACPGDRGASGEERLPVSQMWRWPDSPLGSGPQDLGGVRTSFSSTMWHPESVATESVAFGRTLRTGRAQGSGAVSGQVGVSTWCCAGRVALWVEPGDSGDRDGSQCQSWQAPRPVLRTGGIEQPPAGSLPHCHQV